MTVIIGGTGTANGITSFSSPATFGGTLNTAPRGISNASIPAGGIIQVQQYNYTSVFTTTSGYVTVFGVNITPTSTTSKIFVSCSVLRCGDSWNTGRHFTSIWRNEVTNLIWQKPNNWAATQSDTNSNPYTAALEYLDTPATTSQITYNVRIAPGTSGSVSCVNRTVSSATVEASESTITVMEIAQ